MHKIFLKKCLFLFQFFLVFAPIFFMIENCNPLCLMHFSVCGYLGSTMLPPICGKKFVFFRCEYSSNKNYRQVHNHKKLTLQLTLNFWPIFCSLEETHDWFRIRTELGFQICNKYNMMWRENKQALVLKTKLVKMKIKVCNHSFFNSSFIRSSLI